MLVDELFEVLVAAQVAPVKREAQTRVALLSAPSPEKKLTSGRSRTPSEGMPITPDCQMGLGQPLL